MKIAVIGGGAAGLMAACSVAIKNPDIEISLIEKNSILGNKILISGGGRCNVTTGLSDIKEILKKYPRGANFLKFAMYDFSPKDVMDFFENNGVKLKTEADMRVFPVSDNGKDIVRVFEKILTKPNIKIYKNCTTEKLEKKSRFKIFLSNKTVIETDRLILTTGGQAYSHTGSAGDGYSFAKSMGHKITKLAPSLMGFKLQESWPKKMAGVSFKNVVIKISYRSHGRTFSFKGPFIFTHYGISGPAIFSLSSMSAFDEINGKEPAKNGIRFSAEAESPPLLNRQPARGGSLNIDFFPDISYENLNKNILKSVTASPKKKILHIISEIIPKSLTECFFNLNKINIDKKSNEISKKDLNKIIENLKNCSLTVSGKSFGEEFVTAGGVDLTEIDAKTMQSKIAPGLYFAGEILNIDGFTGGFNLQAAWSTGHLAGKSAAELGNL